MADLAPGLPELFDLDYGAFAEDISFYENIVRRSEGPCLELGVGVGRLAIPLAQAGYEVWGMDISEAMLAHARCKAGAELEGRLQLVQGDMRDFDLGRQFDLILAGLGTFHELLTPDDQAACLRCVQRHLSPGGLFVCDLRPPLYDDWEVGESVPLSHEWTRVLSSTQQTVVKLRSVRVDPARQIRRDTYLYDCLAADGTLRRVLAEIDLRYTSRYEMEGLLRDARLELEQMYGTFDLAPYDEHSEYMITVARKPAEEQR